MTNKTRALFSPRSVFLFAVVLISLAATPAASAASTGYLFGGSNHTCAVVGNDSTVKCWGENGLMQSGFGSTDGMADVLTPIPGPYRTTVSGATTGSANTYASCATRTDGSITCWGAANLFDLDGVMELGMTEPTNLTSGGSPTPTATEVVVGWQHFCGLGLDNPGAVFCWGGNSHGEMGTGSADDGAHYQEWPVSSGAVGLGTADATTCAIIAPSHSVKCWGDNTTGEIGNGTVSEVSGPAAVRGLTGVLQVDGGSGYICALTASRSVKCWGQNDQGQLGDGTRVERHLPTQVKDLAGVLSISVGDSHSCAVLRAGTVKCWGENSSGQLGYGGTSAKLKPVQAATGNGVVSVSAGDQHSCALYADGTIKCWGDNSNGQLGNDALESSLLPTPTLAKFGPPDPAIITNGPLGLVSTSSATLKFTFDEGATATCVLDGVDLGTCSSPTQLSDLTEGSHQFVVRSNNALGSTDSTPYVWTVDLTPPVLAGSATKARIGAYTRINLQPSYDPSGLTQLEYSFNKSAPDAASKPLRALTKDYSASIRIKTGFVVRWVRIRDGAGNWSNWYPVR